MRQVYISFFDELEKLAEEMPKSKVRNDSLAIAGGTAVGGMALQAAGGSGLRKAISTTKDSAESVNTVVNHMKDSKNLNVLRDRAVDPLLSHFNMLTNTVSIPDHHKAVAAHEMGHAQNLKAYQKVLGERGGKALQISAAMKPSGMPLYSVAAMPLLSRKVTEAIKGDDTSSMRHRVGQAIEDNPDKVMAASVVPLLAEEGMASARGLHAMTSLAPKGEKLLELRKGLKTLAPAFGTYAGFAAAPVGLGLGLKYYRDHTKND